MLASLSRGKVLGLSVVVCFAEIFVCMCALRDSESSRVYGDGVNTSCATFCQNNSLNNDTGNLLAFPNCTERCTYAAYTCPDGFISIQTPQPRCIPFTVCSDGSSCNCSSDHLYANNGSEATLCHSRLSCEAKQCEHGCVNNDNGTECSCLPGFILGNDSISCVFDNSSAFLQCDVDCSSGLCLNDTCRCFFGYLLDGNGTCTVKNSSYDCAVSPRFCDELRNASVGGNRTHECKNGTISRNGTCQDSDPCNSATTRSSCERHGKRCRPKDDGDFECYCGLPHYPIQGFFQNDSFCISPVTRVFMYRLSLVIIGSYEHAGYHAMRELEAGLSSHFFPGTINCTLLNLEVASFVVDQVAPIARLDLHASFAEELPYFGELLGDICATYPDAAYEDACILPGNLVVRGSKINYTEIENVCDMDDSVAEFLCGPLARCKPDEGPDRYKCDCIDGYQTESYASPKKPTCVDVDECLEHPCKGPNQVCKNRAGNYSCDCIPCYLWNKTRGECVGLCESNPCEHHGICVLNELVTGCGFHCVCRDEFKGLTCSETNDAIRAAKTNVAITGGILGAILGLTIIVGVLIIYMILKRTGYFSFRASKVALS